MEPLEPIEEAPVATGTRGRLAAVAVAVAVAIALLAVVLVRSGDGKPQDGDPIRRAQSDGSASSTPAETGRTTAPGSTPTTSPGASTGGGTPTTTAPPPSIPTSPDDYKYQVTLSAPCARPGDSFTVVMHLQRDDTASMLVRYADFQDHGAKKAGAAGSDGRFEYTFTVGPTLGHATVVTSAYRRADGRSGTTSMTFEVIEATRSC